MPVQKVLNALSEGMTVTETARQFGISRAAVYRMLRSPGDEAV
ncbi:MAG: helix-turn-helix domain-containing protein [Chloroflexi bacterium]|nr:helix-turn-helix domain-containing protein [Chloroflexota bacterium]